jgi:hypothetical protein
MTARLDVMVLGVGGMAVGDMCLMCRLLVIASLVMFRGFAMVLKFKSPQHVTGVARHFADRGKTGLLRFVPGDPVPVTEPSMAAARAAGNKGRALSIKATKPNHGPMERA